MMNKYRTLGVAWASLIATAGLACAGGPFWAVDPNDIHTQWSLSAIMDSGTVVFDNGADVYGYPYSENFDEYSPLPTGGGVAGADAQIAHGANPAPVNGSIASLWGRLNLDVNGRNPNGPPQPFTVTAHAQASFRFTVLQEVVVGHVFNTEHTIISAYDSMDSTAWLRLERVTSGDEAVLVDIGQDERSNGDLLLTPGEYLMTAESLVSVHLAFTDTRIEFDAARGYIGTIYFPVPAPGVAPVLAVAALLGSRRRR